MSFGSVNTPGGWLVAVKRQLSELAARLTSAEQGLAGHTHTKRQITDFPASMPASDVSAWAKASTKPTYTASEVGAAPAGHTHTPASIGAAAANHTHTATQVGARPSTWTPTAADVGAAPASHTHTASQITGLPTTLPASDVPAWAKAATKPSYTAREVGAAFVVQTTIPEGRMRGDVDGDGVITQDDAFLAAKSVVHAETLTEIEHWCADADGDGGISMIDCGMIARFAEGIVSNALVPTDYYNNWTYNSSTGLWTTDITVKGMTTAMSALVAISGEHKPGTFVNAEVMNGKIRIISRHPPISEEDALIIIYNGNNRGAAVSYIAEAKADDWLPYYVRDNAPIDKTKLWIDTGTNGGLKYWNGSKWKHVPVAYAGADTDEE